MLKVRVRAAYIHAIKSAQNRPKQSFWNRLHGNLISKNTNDFWKSWNQLHNKKKSDLHTVVNGVNTKPEIAESFNGHFLKVSKPNNQQRVDELNQLFENE